MTAKSLHTNAHSTLEVKFYACVIAKTMALGRPEDRVKVVISFSLYPLLIGNHINEPE